MRLALFAVGCLAATSCSIADESETERAHATLVIDAAVYTLDEANPWVESFAFLNDGTIVAVGDEAQVRQDLDELVRDAEVDGDNIEVLDLDGAFVLPGFQDSHVHVPEAGLNNELCPLASGWSLQEYLDALTDCAGLLTGGGWVLATGASLFELRVEADSGDPTKSPLLTLDEALPDRPVLVLDDLGHAAWTNSVGLAMAGISESSTDAAGGVLDRDAKGQLTGLLLEDAQQLVRNVALADEGTVDRGLWTSMQALARNGVTAVGDSGGYWQQGHDQSWLRGHEAGVLTVRAVNSLYLYPSLDLDKQLAAFDQRWRDEPGSLLRVNTVKVYVDGILSLGTAMLIDEPPDLIDTAYPRGFAYFEPALLNRAVDELHRRGFRIEFHTIGDRAVRAALDAVEAIDDTPASIAARRHRTTHTYLVHPDDLSRFGELGVVADLQVGAAVLDPQFQAELEPFVGPAIEDILPVASLLDAGAHVSLSSDWDADPLSPLGTIERAVTRQRNGVADVATAIELVTIDSAYTLGHEELTGSIAVGKKADLVVLEENLFEIAVEDIGEVVVLRTIVDGRTVFQVR